MITLTDVHKRYWTSHGEAHWVLRGISLVLPRDRNVGVIGVNGAGKSTLLRLISGIDQPTRGEVHCDNRVSWPIGLARGMQSKLTGRQNARFLFRVHGYDGAELEDGIRYVLEFSELGAAFDEPVWTYSTGMRGRLNFSLSLAFDFDTYLVDEMMGAGDAAFKEKSRKAMRDLARRATMVVVSHGEGTLRAFCDAAVLLHEGKTHWFESVREALREYRKILPHG